MKTTKIEDRRRVNMYLSHAMYEFFENQANEYGMSVTQSMVVALKTYIDAQKAVMASTTLSKQIERLQEKTGVLAGDTEE